MITVAASAAVLWLPTVVPQPGPWERDTLALTFVLVLVAFHVLIFAALACLRPRTARRLFFVSCLAMAWASVFALAHAEGNDPRYQESLLYLGATVYSTFMLGMSYAGSHERHEPEGR